MNFDTIKDHFFWFHMELWVIFALFYKMADFSKSWFLGKNAKNSQTTSTNLTKLGRNLYFDISNNVDRPFFFISHSKGQL